MSCNSQGHLYINSSDPFDYPVIDPAYLSHPADITLLREGLKLARTLGMTQPLNSTIESEIFPGTAVNTDADWNAWIPGQIGTECVSYSLALLLCFVLRFLRAWRSLRRVFIAVGGRGLGFFAETFDLASTRLSPRSPFILRRLSSRLIAVLE